MTKRMKNEITDYLTEGVWNFKKRCDLATDRMYEWREPLYVADPQLYDDMVDAIADYVSDYDISEEKEEMILEEIEELMLCE